MPRARSATKCKHPEIEKQRKSFKYLDNKLPFLMLRTEVTMKSDIEVKDLRSV